MKFEELDLHPAVAAGIAKNSFEECTPIQEAAIPVILEGKDVAGLAQTGTGKTAAFLLPLMDRIMRSVDAANPDYKPSEGEPKKTRPIFENWLPTNFILVLVPTRELAEQVYQNVKSLGGEAGLKGAVIYGGTSYDKQKDALEGGVQFVVATPGRLIDLYKEHVVDLKQVRAVIFDEADRMFDMGFKDDMKYILNRISQDRQFLVFSATLNFDVLNVAYEYGAQPVEINVSKDQAKAENVADEIFHVGFDEKPGYLLSLLKKHNPQQAIVFSNFKRNVERIAKFLNQNGYAAVGISSLLTQAQRNRVMAQFRSANERTVLVATDVAARGLDIKGVDMVINYELPDDPENYVHRIGRTGRAGEKGLAWSLVGDRDVEALNRIENYLEHKVAIGWLEDGEIITDHKPFPRDFPPERARSSQGGPGGRSHGNNKRRRSPGGGGGGRSHEGRRSAEGHRGKGSSSASGGKRKDHRRGPGRNNEEAGEQQQTQGSGTHRDRRTGRHKNAQGQEGRRGELSKKRRSQRRPNQRPTGPNGSQRKPKDQATTPKTKAATAAKSNGNLGQKITGFIKKIFS
ncbi:MAG: DEAD/DEAH box helicase [Pseudobdellovibrionaceae bacterium]|nr:DEAD/DEAH box helicase [Bdellovibrionales bacterium]USN46518.1 MAG: DEAD/DEAH box helicase [Pseudobdellovibrionaceae bacterium]